MEIPRQYGVSTFIQFPLIGRASQDYCGSAIYASGDVRLIKDGVGTGLLSGTSGFFHIEGGEFIFFLADTDMTYRQIAVKIDDQTSPKIFESQTILVSTYGSVSAQHQFNFNSPTVGVTSGALAISGAVVTVSGIYLSFSGFTLKSDVSGMPGIYAALSGVAHWSDVSGVAMKGDVSGLPGILTAISGVQAGASISAGSISGAYVNVSGVAHWTDVSGVALKTDVSGMSMIPTNISSIMGKTSPLTFTTPNYVDATASIVGGQTTINTQETSITQRK